MLKYAIDKRVMAYPLITSKTLKRHVSYSDVLHATNSAVHHQPEPLSLSLSKYHHKMFFKVVTQRPIYQLKGVKISMKSAFASMSLTNYWTRKQSLRVIIRHLLFL